jgi:hypothetical protein
MSGAIYKGYDARLFRLGIQRSRPAAMIPQAATGSLFTITGGNILMTSFVGEVTTVMKAVATTLKISFTPSAAGTGAADMCIASADQTGAPVGTHYHLPAAVASALAVDDAALSGYAEVLPYQLMPPGVIALVGTGLNDTGRIKWDMTYIPLDDSAQVAVN